MSAAQHTPGPWTLDLSGAGSWAVYVEPTGEFDSHLTIARRGELNHRSAESEANARLIAAAPDGLDAAREALIALVAAPDSVAVQIARRKLNAFIAKATGEAS